MPSAAPLYVVEGTFLRIFDISSPSAPVLLGSFDIGQIANGVTVSGHYAYVANEAGGMTIVDVSTPSSPFLQGIQGVGAGVHVYQTAVSGNAAYLAAGIGGCCASSTRPTASARRRRSALRPRISPARTV